MEFLLDCIVFRPTRNYVEYGYRESADVTGNLHLFRECVLHTSSSSEGHQRKIPSQPDFLIKSTHCQMSGVKFQSGDKENVDPADAFDEEESEKSEPMNFKASGMSSLHASVHFHDYLKEFDGSVISKQRNNECQTKPMVTGCETQTHITGVVNTSTLETQTPKASTSEIGIQINLPIFTFEDIESDDQCSFYTGLPTMGVFGVMFNAIREVKEDDSTNKKPGRPRKMRLIDMFLMVLMRLRLGLLINDISQRFCVGKSTCSRIINEWIDFLNVFSPLVMWPTKETVRMRMPSVFRNKYPNCRVIIDCTEIFTETPQSLANRSLMYSDYKSHMTWKLLLGISPSGVITFISELWAGSISDKLITKKSGLLDKLEPGDAVMADKGFLIADILTPRGIHLIIPPKRNSSAPMTKSQVEKTRRVANLRIHVERAMERIKNFRITLGFMPISVSSQASKVVNIICALSNMQLPLIKDSE